MELWKVHKFCESASLKELRVRSKQLRSLIDFMKVIDTNALKALEIMEQYIELKSLFED
jgi:hypothetical protein